jgi:hypothetical protein
VNNGAAMAAVVIVAIVGFVYYQQIQAQRAAAAAAANPWNQLGTGVGSLISGIGGLVAAGESSS